jgi:hypothetical protein
MSVSNSAQPFASALRSSQSICAFLNRFEKDLDEEVIDADMNEAIADEMDATESRETPLSTRSQTSRYSEKFKSVQRSQKNLHHRNMQVFLFHRFSPTAV